MNELFQLLENILAFQFILQINFITNLIMTRSPETRVRSAMILMRMFAPQKNVTKHPTLFIAV
jgi:hypothetical protein